MFDFLCLVLGFGVGFGTGWFSCRMRHVLSRRAEEDERQSVEKNHNALQIEFAKMAERHRMVEDQLQTSQSELAQERQFNISLHAELSRERAGRSHLEQKLEHQKTDLSQFQNKLSQEFRNVVQQVLEEKSQSLSDLHKSNLNLLLQPISEKLQDFKQKIEEQHYRETRELIVLHNKLANLESGRWRQNNGGAAAPPPASPPQPFPNPPSVDEAPVIPEEPEETARPLNHLAPAVAEPILVPADPSASPVSDADAFQSFSPKQEVEIDNFLKRTIGRAQRKKPGE